MDTNPRRSEVPVPLNRGVTDAGLIGTIRSGAYLVTGLALGVIDLTVGISADRPDPRLEDYENVVEAGVIFDTPDIALVGWAAATNVPLSLPAGAGSYRLRYHARGMDEANDRTSEVPLDFFLLQIWPEPASPHETLKISSKKARNWTTQ